MEEVFDDQEIGFECPKCGHQFTEKIGRLRRSPEMDCVACGVSISIEADELRRASETMTESVQNFLKVFDRLS